MELRKIQPRAGWRRWRAQATLVALVALLGASPQAASADSKLTCERIPELLVHYLQKHIEFHYPNDELRDRVIESYLRRIDPSKTLLLRSEVDEMEKQLAGILLDVKSGDCSVLAKIQADLPGRYERMQEYVTEYVERDDYAVDRGVTLVIDSEKRSRPATPEERQLLWQKLVHFQMSNYLVSLAAEKQVEAKKDETPEQAEARVEVERLAEAKRRLVHRYELMTRRAQELDETDIYSGFLDSFARSLDPHSNYLSAQIFEDFQIGMNLSLEGIGVALSSRDGYSVVEKIIPGGATDRIDALKPKDKIIAVAQEDGEFVDVIDMDLRDVVRLIRGKRGTKVNLLVLREGKERLEVAIERDKINLEEQAAKVRFEQIELEAGQPALKLALIELPSFYGDRNPARRQSSRDVRKLLRQIRKEGVDGVVLDLSRNGGGLLENAVEIAGLFVESGGMVAVKDTNGRLQVLRDPDESIAYDGPLVLLTSRVSASASEIVAGALKDYNRAVLVGDDHTFGKGTVQSMVQLPEGLGALKVTTALFFRPGGHSTQHSGVGVDVELPPAFPLDDFGEEHQPYSIEPQQIAPFLGGDDVVDASTSTSLAWPNVSPTLVAELSTRSSSRVQESDEFAKMREDIEEARKRNGVVELSDIFDEDEEAEDAAAEKDAETEDDEKKLTPQQREALHVLADYVALSRQSVAYDSPKP